MTTQQSQLISGYRPAFWFNGENHTVYCKSCKLELSVRNYNARCDPTAVYMHNSRGACLYFLEQTEEERQDMWANKLHLCECYISHHCWSNRNRLLFVVLLVIKITLAIVNANLPQDGNKTSHAAFLHPLLLIGDSFWDSSWEKNCRWRLIEQVALTIMFAELFVSESDFFTVYKF